MAVCEICSAGITGSVNDVPHARVFSAVRKGYEPGSATGAGRSREQQHEDFLVLLAMHEPTWTLCPDCCNAVQSHADMEADGSARVPDVIRIVGNGFRPDPAEWRVILGAWVDRLERKGIEVSFAGIRLEIEQRAWQSFEDFIDVVSELRGEYPDRLADDLVTQDIRGGMALVAVWSLRDSQAIAKTR